jgi:hypothetical protein
MLSFLEETPENQYSPTPKSQWLSAAKKWRRSYHATRYGRLADGFTVPYWNYAANPLLPDIATAVNIKVVTPLGPIRTFKHNPMASYQLKDSNGKVMTFGSLPTALQIGAVSISRNTFHD